MKEKKNPEKKVLYKKILIAMDESRHAEEVKNQGLLLAKVLGASVTVLYVVEETIYVPASPHLAPPPIVPSLKYSKEEGKKIVEKVIERGKEMGVEVTSMIVVGHPASEIISRAKNHDLVVMGTLGRSGFPMAKPDHTRQGRGAAHYSPHSLRCIPPLQASPPQRVGI